VKILNKLKQLGNFHILFRGNAQYNMSHNTHTHTHTHTHTRMVCIYTLSLSPLRGSYFAPVPISRPPLACLRNAGSYFAAWQAKWAGTSPPSPDPEASLKEEEVAHTKHSLFCDASEAPQDARASGYSNERKILKLQYVKLYDANRVLLVGANVASIDGLVSALCTLMHLATHSMHSHLLAPHTLSIHNAMQMIRHV
jgi:hypothetical protein